MTAANEVEAMFEEEAPMVRVDAGAMSALARSEVEAQLDAAHKYPRSIGKFLKEAKALATMTVDIAESCIYSLPRGGKPIRGPSVRLAEIAASAFGNLHVAARTIGAEDAEVISQGVAWDLEKNLRVTVESRRSIKSKGVRYNDDMVTVTGNAAASIALRNAIFRVIPGAYIQEIYGVVREVAVGNATTLVERRTRLFEKLSKMGILPDRVLARVEKPTVEDVGLDEMETLIGLGTAIKNGDTTIDQAFPAVSRPASVVDLEARLRAEKPKAAAPAPTETPPASPPAPAPANSVQDPTPVRPSPSPPPAARAPRGSRKPEPEPPFGGPPARPATPAPSTPTPPADTRTLPIPGTEPKAAPDPREVACAVCGKPVVHGISTFLDGKQGLRHAACSQAAALRSCSVCEKPIGATEAAVSTAPAREGGPARYRHSACNPLLRGEPADSPPPDDWQPHDDGDAGNA